MNPEQWLSLKWNGGSTMSDRWLNQSKIIHMPGKINPVIPEVVSQVAYLIIGHDYTITMAAEAGQCEEYIEKSVGISTALCPYIGYAKSAEIAKKSLKTGISVKELVLEEGLLKEEELKEI